MGFGISMELHGTEAQLVLLRGPPHCRHSPKHARYRPRARPPTHTASPVCETHDAPWNSGKHGSATQ